MVAAAVIGGAVIGAGASIYSGNQAADATQAAANTAAGAQHEANMIQKEQFDKQYADNASFRDITQQALYTYADELGLGGSRPTGWVSKTPSGTPTSPTFNAPNFNDYQNSDVYKNSVEVGEKAIGRMSPVYASGSRLKALLDYNTNLASNFRQEARSNAQQDFNNAQITYQNTVNAQDAARNRLASLLGAGQTNQQFQAQLGQTVANNIAQGTINTGNTIASTQIAQGQIQANTTNQVGNIIGKGLTSYLTMPSSTPAYTPYPSTAYTSPESGLTYNLPGSGY